MSGLAQHHGMTVNELHPDLAGERCCMEPNVFLFDSPTQAFLSVTAPTTCCCLLHTCNKAIKQLYCSWLCLRAGVSSAMVGMKVGETREVQLTLPDNFEPAALRGVPVTCQVGISELFEYELAEVKAVQAPTPGCFWVHRLLLDAYPPFLFCPVLPCPALPCPALPCPVLSFPVLSCPVLSCPVLSCHFFSYFCFVFFSSAYNLQLFILGLCRLMLCQGSCTACWESTCYAFACNRSVCNRH